MQIADREEFLRELSKLCAGFGVPLTKAREESYWTALARMALPQFRRCIEHALGPDYDGDDFPKTGQIWRIYKGTAVTQSSPAAKALPVESDHLEYFANRLLWLHVSHRGGLGSTGTFVPGERHISGMNDCHESSEMQLCLRYKRDLVTQFCGFVEEGDVMATPAAFIRWWVHGLARISEVLPRTARAYSQAAAEEGAQKPFPASMARMSIPDQPAAA